MNDVASRSEEALPGFIDAWVDPRGAAHRVGSSDEIVRLRVEPELGEPRAPFGPTPVAPRVAELGSDCKPQVDGKSFPVDAVELRTRTLAWGKLATPFERAVGEVAIVGPNGARLVCAETVAVDEDTARQRLAPLARALSERMHLAVPSGAEGGEIAEAPRRSPGRYRYRLEADRWVLRDHESIGPRASASRFATFATVLGVLALASAAVVVSQLLGRASMSVLIPSASLAVVLGVATFALAEVARYARSYTANSNAVAWFADDRVVVAPWVARDGAIDIRPEGQVGAGMRVAEVRGVRRDVVDGAIVLVLDTEHGPFELMRLANEDEAEAATRSIEEALGAVASPRQKKTALMRAREKRGTAAPLTEAS